MQIVKVLKKRERQIKRGREKQNIKDVLVYNEKAFFIFFSSFLTSLNLTSEEKKLFNLKRASLHFLILALPERNPFFFWFREPSAKVLKIGKRKMR